MFSVQKMKFSHWANPGLNPKSLEDFFKELKLDEVTAMTTTTHENREICYSQSSNGGDMITQRENGYLN